MNSAKFVKETLLIDNWLMKVDYILAFTTFIHDVSKKNRYRYGHSSLSL